MAIQLPTPEQAIQITRQSIRNNFPRYREEHKVDSSYLNNERDLWIGYRTKWSGGFEIIESTHFDLNIQEGIFYLVSIALDSNERGKGLGWRLYQAAFDAAKNLGFQFIRQTPSGGFHKNEIMVESRMDYLLRKGCILANPNEVDWIIR